MNKTDKNIQKLLIDNNKFKSLDVNLEDNIMDKINNQTDYKAVLIKTKRNAKRGIALSLILLVIYGIVTYFELLTSNGLNQSKLINFYPTIFTALVVMVVYLEITFGVSVFRKSLRD